MADGKTEISGAFLNSNRERLVALAARHTLQINVLHTRLQAADGKISKWRSSALWAYQRRTLAADALIASAYLAGTNT